jgi:hypothetical protein
VRNDLVVRTPLHLLLATLAAAIVTLAGCTDSPRDAAVPATSSMATRCAPGVAQARQWRHVVWVWFENRSWSRVAGPDGTWTFARTRLARECASMRSMSAVQRASLANYVAAVTGSADGIAGGCSPAQCPVGRASIFAQVAEDGREWRSWQESLPSPCLGRDAGRYVVRHDPAAYLPALHADCRRWDLPLDAPDGRSFAAALARDELPAFAIVTPDTCHGGHDCGDHAADRWLRTFVTQLRASRAWRDGDVALFVLWDEGDRDLLPGRPVNDPCPSSSLRADCHVPAFVVAPGVPAGTSVEVRIVHVDVLQLTQRMLGLRPLLGADRPAAVRVGRQLRVLR